MLNGSVGPLLERKVEHILPSEGVINQANRPMSLLESGHPASNSIRIQNIDKGCGHSQLICTDLCLLFMKSLSFLGVSLFLG